MPHPLMQSFNPHSLSHLSVPTLSHLHHHHHPGQHPQSNDHFHMIPTHHSAAKLPSPDKVFERLRDIYDGSELQSPSGYAVPPPPAPGPPPSPVAPIPSQYLPQQYQPYGKPSCGSNIVIGCQPQVQTIPCYGPSPYALPPTPPPLPPSPPQPTPPPPSPYAVQPSPYAVQPSPPVYSYSQRPASYFIATSDDASVDVYTKPGPPYLSEPTLGSAVSKLHGNVTSARDKSDATNVQRSDNRPESTVIEKKTETENATEMIVGDSRKIDSTTPATLQPLPISGENEERVKELHDKINDHVESLEQFRKMARAKLRDAVERSSSISDDEFEGIHNYLGLTPTYQKRQLMTNYYTNPYLTNSVW